MENKLENIEENADKSKKIENFAKNLENEFNNFGDNGDKNEKTSDNFENNSNFKPFVIPDFVLNFLQDKPIWLQKQILCKNLSPDQIKEVESIFKPSQDELVISRQLVKKYLEKLVQAFPEVEKYISDEAVFLGSWTISFIERKRLINGYVDSLKTKDLSIS